MASPTVKEIWNLGAGNVQRAGRVICLDIYNARTACDQQHCNSLSLSPSPPPAGEVAGPRLREELGRKREGHNARAADSHPEQDVAREQEPLVWRGRQQQRAHVHPPQRSKGHGLAAESVAEVPEQRRAQEPAHEKS